MTKISILHLALHTHKHGATPYFFPSPLTVDQFPDERGVPKILNIDYEPDLLETIEYFRTDAPESIPAFDARWCRIAQTPAITPADTLRVF